VKQRNVSSFARDVKLNPPRPVADNVRLTVAGKFRRYLQGDFQARGVSMSKVGGVPQMRFTDMRCWNWPMLAVIAFWTLPLTGATQVSRMDEPWPALLSSEPAETDAEFATLQLRANVTLARLMEAGHDGGRAH
jgi:hypothetical protein